MGRAIIGRVNRGTSTIEYFLVLGLLFLCASFGVRSISESVEFSEETSDFEQQMRRRGSQAAK